MEREPPRKEQQPEVDLSESGMPGGGKGRRDEPGQSGVYPASAAEGAAGDAPLRGQAEWGQGERGAAGYEDSGSSELNFDLERDLEVLNEDVEGENASQSEP
jgi:hypothetical protein